jgi:hypothetical protein
MLLLNGSWLCRKVSGPRVSTARVNFDAGQYEAGELRVDDITGEVFKSTGVA